MKHLVLIGQTDYTALVFIPDPASTDGSGKTGLVAANLTVSGVRVETDNDVTVTDYTSSLNNLAALTTAHTDWGVLEVSSTLAPGLYRIDFADALFASGAWSCVVYVMVTTSAAAASPMEFLLVADNPQTALATAAALDTVDNFLDTEIADIQARLPAALTGDGNLKVDTLRVGGTLQTAGDIPALITAVDDLVDTELAAVKTVVDSILVDTAEIGAAGAGLTAVTDQVWDEAIAGHLSAGTTGLALNSAGAAGDPWSTALPGAYGAGTAGLILGTTVPTALTAIDDFLDTEIAAIKAKTDNIPASPASVTTVQTSEAIIISDIALLIADVQTDTDNIQTRLPAALVGGRMDSSVGAMAADVMTAAAAAADLTTELQAGLATAAALATLDDFVDTEVAAIKVVTDNLATALELDGAVYRYTANALEQGPSGSGPTAAAIADAVWDEAIADHAGAGSTGQSLAAAGGAADPLLNAVPGAYASGTAGFNLGYIDEIKAKTDQLGSQAITLISPVYANGDVTIVKGDSYVLSDSTQLEWTRTGWINLTGVTLVQVSVRVDGGATTTFTGSAPTVGAGAQTIRLELTAAQTVLLANGAYDIQITLGGKIHTLLIGRWFVTQDVTP